MTPTLAVTYPWRWLWLPYLSPPLRSNTRMHWRRRAELTAQIRRDTAMVAGRCVTPPIPGPVTVTCVWAVTDRRVRDVGASAPTLKAAIDGLVDAGVLSADDHTVVTEERYRIEMGTRKGVRIEVQAA